MDKFDKKLKDILDEEVMTPPSDLFVWEQMDIEIPEKKPRKKWYLFFFIGLLIVGTIFFSQRFMQLNRISTENRDQESSLIQNEQYRNASNQKKKSVTTSNQAEANETMAMDDIKSSADTEIAEPSKSKSTTRKTLVSDKVPEDIAEQSENDSKNTAQIIDSNVSQGAATIPQPYNKATQTLTIGAFNDKSESKADTDVVDSQLINNTETKSKSIEGTLRNPNENSTLQILKIPIHISDQIISESVFDPVGINDKFIIVSSLVEYSASSVEIITSKRKWLIALEAGSNYSHSEFVSVPETDLTRFNKGLQNYFGRSTELLIGRQITDGLTVSAGIGYFQYKSLLKDRILLSSEVDIETQSLVQTTVNTYKRVIHNNISSGFNVPIRAQLRLAGSDRFDVGVRAGMIWSFNLNSEGVIPIEGNFDTGFESFENIFDGLSPPQTQLGGMAGLYLGLNLNRSLSMSANIDFQRNKDFTEVDFAYAVPWIIHQKVGIYYKL